MSEYWKSTPKYYCKHCDLYVRDTKLERTNHEASVKHQNNLKRFLRDLHRKHDQEQREKDRAKREVDRLNGVVSAPNASSSSAPGRKQPAGQSASDQRQQQWEQLADMGVEIPSELRRDMAMAGDWTITETRIIDDDEKDDKEKVEAKATGVRKRQKEEHEEEEEEAIQGLFKKKPKWGRDSRQAQEDDPELDALLSGSLMQPKKAKEEEAEEDTNDSPVKKEDDAGQEANVVKKEEPHSPLVKTEDPEGLAGDAAVPVKAEGGEASDVKSAEPAVPTVVFKKRKPKNVRQQASKT